MSIMSFIHLKDFLQQSLRTSPMYRDSARSRHSSNVRLFWQSATSLGLNYVEGEKKKLQYFSQSRWSMLYQPTHFYASAATVVINFLQSVWKPIAENNFRSPPQLQK